MEGIGSLGAENPCATAGVPLPDSPTRRVFLVVLQVLVLHTPQSWGTCPRPPGHLYCPPVFALADLHDHLLHFVRVHPARVPHFFTRDEEVE